VLAPTTAQPLVTEQVAAYPAAVVPPPERRTSSGLIVAIVASSLAVVLLIVAIVLVLARGDDGEQTTSTSRPSLPPTTTPVTETTVPTTTAAPATTAPPAAATTVPSGAATTTPPVAPSTTVFGDLGFPGLPMTRPACDGSYITIVASLFGSDVAALTADALAEYPGTQYLRTDQTCPSLRPDVDGFPIYVVYFGPFRGTNEACPARALGPADAYVKQLSTALPPNHVVSC
jgi:serine/threonine-protein kinase